MDYSFGKIPTFLSFLTPCFHTLRRRSFFLQYLETHFHGLFCHKNKDGKFLIFWRKPWTNNFEKNLNFSFFFICSKAFLGCIFSFPAVTVIRVSPRFGIPITKLKTLVITQAAQAQYESTCGFAFSTWPSW